jgi:hypothetical protein
MNRLHSDQLVDIHVSYQQRRQTSDRTFIRVHTAMATSLNCDANELNELHILQIFVYKWSCRYFNDAQYVTGVFIFIV